jgi:DNA-cytosine methyltransferase
MFSFGSLFSGIGGLDLGLERAGMTCMWQVENDAYAGKVLAKHWPTVRRFQDIHGVGSHNLSPVDCIAGGFPCQDISQAGKGAGITGERSGLWKEQFRIISELRPRYALVENVAALRGKGLSEIIADFSSIGYDAEWNVVSAASVGALHLRKRLFIVAYANRCQQQFTSDGRRCNQDGCKESSQRLCSGNTVSHTDSHGWETLQFQHRIFQEQSKDTIQKSCIRYSPVFGGKIRRWDVWAIEPGLGGNLDGFASWLDRHNRLTHEAHECIMTYVTNNTLGDIHNDIHKKDRAREILRVLRDTIETETFQRETGRLQCISSSQVLLSYLCKLESRYFDENRLQLQGATVSEINVRSVQVRDEHCDTPHRPKQREQQRREYTNTLQALSRFLARYAEKAWVDYRRENAVNCWEDGIARVANGTPDRMDRLRCIGNAVVPQVGEFVGDCLLKHAERTINV